MIPVQLGPLNPGPLNHLLSHAAVQPGRQHLHKLTLVLVMGFNNNNNNNVFQLKAQKRSQAQDGNLTWQHGKGKPPSAAGTALVDPRLLRPSVRTQLLQHLQA